MSKFNELHEHLKECVDSDNDSFIGITEDGVEFNMYEWAFGLSVQAKNEHDKLVEALKSLAYCAENNTGARPSADCYYRALDESKKLLKELGYEI